MTGEQPIPSRTGSSGTGSPGGWFGSAPGPCSDMFRRLQSECMNDILSLDEFSENEGLLLYAKDDFEQIEYRLMSERFDKMLNKLSHRELTVIKLRYGFIDGKTYTLEEIGKQLGVTRERIRQIEKKALKKLKHSVTHYFRDIKLYYNL